MYRIMRLNCPDKNHLFIDLWDDAKSSGAEIKLYFICEKQCTLAEFLFSKYRDTIIDFKFIQNVYDYCLQTELTDDDIKAIRYELRASKSPLSPTNQKRYNFPTKNRKVKPEEVIASTAQHVSKIKTQTPRRIKK